MRVVAATRAVTRVGSIDFFVCVSEVGVRVMLREETVEALRVGQETVLSRAADEPGQGNDDENEADETGEREDGARKCFVLLSESRKRGLGGCVVLAITKYVARHTCKNPEACVPA